MTHPRLQSDTMRPSCQRLAFLPFLSWTTNCPADDPVEPALVASFSNTTPGPEYAASAQKDQGVPGLERTKSGRLRVLWYAGGLDEGEGNDLHRLRLFAHEAQRSPDGNVAGSRCARRQAGICQGSPRSSGQSGDRSSGLIRTGELEGIEISIPEFEMETDRFSCQLADVRTILPVGNVRRGVAEEFCRVLQSEAGNW